MPDASPTAAAPAPRPEPAEASWLVLLPVGLAAFVFWPRPDQYFQAEDLYHLYRAVNQPWPALLLQQHGGHVYAAFSTLMALCHALFGLRPDGWFATLLALHLVNVALCFGVMRLVVGSPALAAVGSLLWAVAPTHAHALDWFTMSGQVLATTMILAVVRSALAHAGGPGAVRGALWLVAMLVAATANGAGTAAALVLPLAAFLLLPPGAGRRRSACWLAAGVPLVIAAVVTCRLAASHVTGILPTTILPLVPGPGARGATQLLFVELLKQGLAGPLVALATPTPGAATTWIAGAVWLTLAGFAVRRADDAARRQLAGALLLVAAVYGATALARGGLYAILARATEGEAGALPRYHYLASAAGLLATVVVARVLLASRPAPAMAVRAAPLLVAAALLAARIHRPLVLDPHAQTRAGFAAARVALETAARRAAPPGATARLPNAHTPGVAGIAPHHGFPGWLAVLVLTEPDGTLDGRRIVLTEPNPRVRALADAGVRTRGLLVPP